jgi:hypothetical protein
MAEADPLNYRSAGGEPVGKRDSGLGKASLWAAIASWAGWLALYLLIVGGRKFRYGPVAWFLLAMIPLLALVGLIAGVAGIMRKGFRRTDAIVGLLLSALHLILMAVVIAFLSYESNRIE